MSFVELESFLKSDNGEIRKVAAGHLCSLSPTNECVDFFKSRNLDIFVTRLKDLPIIVVDVLRFLINISREKVVQDNLSNSKQLYSTLTEMIVDFENPLADLACMVLSNITLSEKGCKNLLELKGKQSFRSLMDILATEKSPNPKANFHYLALVFANVTQISEGRKSLFTDRENSPIPRLSKLAKSNKVILRGGILSGIKNCCFETEHHEWIVEKGNILEYVIAQLALSTDLDEEERRTAPKYFYEIPNDKKREGDLGIISVILDTILLLCSTLRVRKTLRDSQVYPIIREVEKVIDEKHEHVKETIYGIVNMLVRDDQPEQEDDEGAITVIE